MRRKCIEKMEKGRKKGEDKVNGYEKNWWEMERKYDKIKKENFGMRLNQFKISFFKTGFGSK